MTTGEKFEKVADAVYKKGASDFGTPFDVTGTSLVTIDKVHPKEHDAKVELTSKNLIPFPYANMSVTHKGVTFTVNDDGTVTANGTNDGTGSSYIAIYQAGKKPLPIGTYTMSGAPTEDTYLQFSGLNVESSANKSRTFTITEVQTQNLVTCCVRSGKTVDNVVFKPQIEKGSVATPYTPYVSDLSVIESATACGKNLFDISIDKRTEYVRNGIGLTVNDDGSFNLKGTLRNSNYSYLHYSDFSEEVMPLKMLIAKGTTVVSSAAFDSDDVYVGLTFYGADRKMVVQASGLYNGQSRKITLDKDVYGIGYVFACPNNAAGDMVEIRNLKLQCEIGSVATEWEAYKGGTYPVTDGKAIVKSVSPTMNITTPTSGVSIEAKGYLDGQAIINELTQAIVDLGGEI